MTPTASRGAGVGSAEERSALIGRSLPPRATTCPLEPARGVPRPGPRPRDQPTTAGRRELRPRAGIRPKVGRPHRDPPTGQADHEAPIHPTDLPGLVGGLRRDSEPVSPSPRCKPAAGIDVELGHGRPHPAGQQRRSPARPPASGRRPAGRRAATGPAMTTRCTGSAAMDSTIRLSEVSTCVRCLPRSPASLPVDSARVDHAAGFTGAQRRGRRRAGSGRGGLITSVMAASSPIDRLAVGGSSRVATANLGRTPGSRPPRSAAAGSVGGGSPASRARPGPDRPSGATGRDRR